MALILHARFPRAPSLGAQLLRLADRYVPRLRLALLTAFVTLRQALRGLHRRLVQAVGLDHGTGLVSDPLVTQALHASEQRLVQDVRPLLMTLATQAAQTLTPALRRTLRLETLPLPTTQLSTALDAQMGTLIRQINEATLRTVRASLRQSLVEGVSVPAMARRLETVIGLTDRQAGALLTLRSRLLKEGQTAGQVQQQVARATRQFLQHRALLIARTESVNAVNLGQHLLYEAAAAAGTWPDTLRRIWVAVADACTNICQPVPGMNPDGVPLHTPFATPVGPRMYPTLHPGCRCHVELREVPAL